MNNNVKSFYILIASLSVLNYFDSSTKLFLELYLAKFLNALSKPFFFRENIHSEEKEFTRLCYCITYLYQNIYNFDKQTHMQR